MNNTVRIIFVTTLLLFIATINHAKESKWYNIGEDDKVIADLTLRPKAKKAVTVRSSEAKKIMFQAEAKPGDWERIQKGPYPIEFKQIGTKNVIQTFYGGFSCEPINGVITLELTNLSEREQRVVVFEPIGWADVNISIGQ